MSVPIVCNVIHETPILAAATSTGKTKYWQGRAGIDERGYYTATEFWQEGSVHQTSARVYVTGKQKRDNRAQAIFEITSSMQKKLDKGYQAMGENHGLAEQIRPPILPMLAHTLTERGHKLVFPCYVQAKENGHRCLYDGRTFWSRQGNAFVAESVAHLHLPLVDGWVLDGELVLPPPYSFQDTTGAIKKFRPDLSSLLEYRVYDLYDHNDPIRTFRERLRLLIDALPSRDASPVYVVETYLADDDEQLIALHTSFVTKGYEGSIARNVSGVYKPTHRSVDLLKIKDMQDAEFTIVAFCDGVGKDEGAIIFVCQTADGKRFNVRPSGPTEERRRMFAAGARYVGRQLTVQYQTLTDGGVPYLPVGLTVREDL